MKKLYIVLFTIGIILLGINILGLFKTMRNPDLYTEEYRIRNRINDVTIPYPEIKKILKREAGESDIDFACRVNQVVHEGFAHYLREEGIDKYHLRVPVWENYLLFAASYINPKKYRIYEFTNYKKNLERGVGLCSTHSIVVKGVLMKEGIKTELLDIGKRHVVNRVEFNSNTAYILDPDYGVVVPYDTAAITANPELVRGPYANMSDCYYPDAIDPYTTDFIVEIYGKRKHTYEVNNRFEAISYWLKWLIPLLLITPFAIYRLKKRFYADKSASQLS